MALQARRGSGIRISPREVRGAHRILPRRRAPSRANEFAATTTRSPPARTAAPRAVNFPREARLCPCCHSEGAPLDADRKSTRLNSSHANISYAVFCLKKKKRELDPL